MPLAWVVFACLLLTFFHVRRLAGEPWSARARLLGVPTINPQFKRKILWHLKEAPQICLGLLVFQLQVKAEEKKHLVILWPNPSSLPSLCSFRPSLLRPPQHTSPQSCPVGYSASTGATPSPGMLSPHPSPGKTPPRLTGLSLPSISGQP